MRTFVGCVVSVLFITAAPVGGDERPAPAPKPVSKALDEYRAALEAAKAAQARLDAAQKKVDDLLGRTLPADAQGTLRISTQAGPQRPGPFLAEGTYPDSAPLAEHLFRAAVGFYYGHLEHTLNKLAWDNAGK